MIIIVQKFLKETNLVPEKPTYHQKLSINCHSKVMAFWSL